MRSFYEEWSPIINRQPMADENLFSSFSLSFNKIGCGSEIQN